MKHCHYCGKELKETQLWCPYCMRRQKEATPFENTSIKREVRHARAVRLLPCCLAAAFAVVLTAVLLSATLHHAEPASADTPPSEQESPVVLTEPETVTDLEITAEVPSAAVSSPSISPAQDYVLREVDMDFYAQELTKYLHQQYPNHLIPSEKRPGMKQELFYLNTNVYHEQTWRYEIGLSAYDILSATKGLSFCYDKNKVRGLEGGWEFGKDVSYYYPEEDSPLLSTALFTIEYLGRLDEYRHQFALYYFKERPVPETDAFNSELFIQMVRERMPPQYTYIDSFVKEEVPYREVDFGGIGTFYQNETDLTQQLINFLDLNFSNYASYPYYDVYIAEYSYDKTTGKPHIAALLLFFEEIEP